jgi:trans-2,3-dihydro-3-hydroxyanthranilate isomerase
MRYAYRLVNVFTQDRGRLTGNPLCVFEDGRELTDEQMQALALQFNLSETTFIFPAEDAHARVRIFTPAYEMPFAGHPTLGSAHVVRSLKNTGDEVKLRFSIGVIPVRAQKDRWELSAKAAKTRAPKASRSEVSAALGIEERDLAGEPLWVDSGTEQLIVPLASPEAVRKVQVDTKTLQAVTQDGPRAQAYVFAPAGDEALLARFFFTKGHSIAEDPATGSATANLGGWYLANKARVPLTKRISQGEMAGRPSSLQLRIDEERNVFVAGEVIELGRGYLDL